MNPKYIKTFIAVSFAFLSAPVLGQNLEDDALLYSQSELIGTARIKAIGGAQVALGGDLGTFGINPAGVAFYRSSDLGISFGYNSFSNSSTYLGNETDDTHGKITVPQFGVVIANARGGNDGSFNARWNNFAFGISYLKTHDFNNTFSYQGFNESSSITSFFADRAWNRYGGTGLPDVNNPIYLEDVAYAAGIINEAEVDGEATFVGVSEYGNVQQYGEVARKGGVSEMSLTLGGNYGNQLFLGAALTYVNVRQENETYYTEYDINDPSYPFDITSFDYIKNYEQRGSGFNAKLGVIYLPVEDVRVGVSLQSPSFIKFEEDNSDDIITLESNGESYNSSTSGTFEYDITTPLKVSAGLAKFFGDQGFLSADVEYVDYSKIDFDSEFRETNTIVNGQIEDRFKNAVNFRVGGEYKLDAISLRLGYAYFGSPYENTEEDFSRNYFTGGIGYRYNTIYVDLAGIYNQSSTSQVPYFATGSGGEDISPIADITHNRFGVMLTVGTRF